MEECYFQNCNFTKRSTPPWVFFTFFKLYKWYQISQSVSTIQNMMDKVINAINFALISNFQITCPNMQTLHLRAPLSRRQETVMTRPVKVHKTFRRHFGRLLNALCTFNIRPLFKGIQGIFLQPQKQIQKSVETKEDRLFRKNEFNFYLNGISEVELKKQFCLIYRPLYLPTHSLLTMGSFSLSSNLIPGSSTSILRYAIHMIKCSVILIDCLI